MNAKEKHKYKLLEYIGNPENEFPDRLSMAVDVIGFKHAPQIYKVFTPDEISEIEAEGLALRRKKYQPEIAKVDKALFKEAKDGNVHAAKLIFQKFEGWSERQKVEHTGKDGEPIEVTAPDLMNLKGLQDAIKRPKKTK